MPHTAVQPTQAPEDSLAFRPATSERLISRVLFQMPDGSVHQTSIYSTLVLALVGESPEAAARIKQYTEIYTAIGARVLHMEFVSQVALELGQ